MNFQLIQHQGMQGLQGVQGLIPTSMPGVPGTPGVPGYGAPPQILGQHVMAGRGILAAAPSPGMRPMMTQGGAGMTFAPPMMARGMSMMALGRGAMAARQLPRPGFMTMAQPQPVLSPSLEGSTSATEGEEKKPELSEFSQAQMVAMAAHGQPVGMAAHGQPVGMVHPLLASHLQSLHASSPGLMPTSLPGQGHLVGHSPFPGQVPQILAHPGHQFLAQQMGAGQLGAGQIGAGQLGAGQLGAGQLGAGQLAQLGAGQMMAHQLQDPQAAAAAAAQLQFNQYVGLQNMAKVEDTNRYTESPVVEERDPDAPEVESERVSLDFYNSDLNFIINKDGYTASVMNNPAGFCFCWSGARATYGVIRGKICFEVLISEHLRVDFGEDHKEQDPHLVRVGWSLDSTTFQLGEEPNSYGYGGTAKFSSNNRFHNFGEPFTKGDVIMALLDLEARPPTISYMKNGTWLGVATQLRGHRTGQASNALFPHILSKNCGLEVNFGQRESWYPPPQGFTYIDHVPLAERIRGLTPPPRKADCEIIMIVGLPGAGKTTWALKQNRDQPNKRYNIIGTDTLIEKMRVNGLPRKKNYHGRWDVLIQKATNCLNKLFNIASRRRRNYILDQTNVYASARRRKMKNFVGFNRVCAIIQPEDSELKRREWKRTHEDGKYVPESAVYEMKANYSLPIDSETHVDEIRWIELPRDDAEKIIAGYNEEGQANKGNRDDLFPFDKFKRDSQGQPANVGRGAQPPARYGTSPVPDVARAQINLPYGSPPDKRAKIDNRSSALDFIKQEYEETQQAAQAQAEATSKTYPASTPQLAGYAQQAAVLGYPPQPAGYMIPGQPGFYPQLPGMMIPGGVPGAIPASLHGAVLGAHNGAHMSAQLHGAVHASAALHAGLPGAMPSALAGLAGAVPGASALALQSAVKLESSDPYAQQVALQKEADIYLQSYGEQRDVKPYGQDDYWARSQVTSASSISYGTEDSTDRDSSTVTAGAQKSDDRYNADIQNGSYDQYGSESFTKASTLSDSSQYSRDNRDSRYSQASSYNQTSTSSYDRKSSSDHRSSSSHRSSRDSDRDRDRAPRRSSREEDRDQGYDYDRDYSRRESDNQGGSYSSSYSSRQDKWSSKSGSSWRGSSRDQDSERSDRGSTPNKSSSGYSSGHNNYSHSSGDYRSQDSQRRKDDTDRDSRSYGSDYSSYRQDGGSSYNDYKSQDSGSQRSSTYPANPPPKPHFSSSRSSGGSDDGKGSRKEDRPRKSRWGDAEEGESATPPVMKVPNPGAGLLGNYPGQPVKSEAGVTLDTSNLACAPPPPPPTAPQSQPPIMGDFSAGDGYSALGNKPANGSLLGDKPGLLGNHPEPGMEEPEEDPGLAPVDVPPPNIPPPGRPPFRGGRGGFPPRGFPPRGPPGPGGPRGPPGPPPRGPMGMRPRGPRPPFMQRGPPPRGPPMMRGPPPHRGGPPPPPGMRFRGPRPPFMR